MKILAFAASNSRQSINKQLVTYAASLLKEKFMPEADIEVLDINDYEMPIYSIDRQNEEGVPQKAHQFLEKIEHSDLLLVSFAEHNGGYTAAFKNLFDWASRATKQVYQNKPSVYLSTSPGGAGAGSVMASAKGSAEFFGSDLKGSLSVPFFNDNFDKDLGRLSNPELQLSLEKVLSSLVAD